MQWQRAILAILMMALATSSLLAQGRSKARAQEFNPTQFFDQFLGTNDKVRDAELAKIDISRKEENRLGEQELKAFQERLALRDIKLTTRGSEVTYLAQLLADLQPCLTQAKRYSKFQVHYYEVDDPQAYMLSGGQLLISSGLLEQVGSEAALVCVLGHELAHLDRGHLLRRAKQLKLMQQRMKSPGEFSPEKMFQSFDSMQQLFRRPFGPEEELQADRDGIQWAWKLGYDPRAIEALYAALDKADPGEFLPAFLRTHPPSAERRENLAATFAELEKRPVADELYLGRENLRRRITKSEQRFDE